MVQNKLLRLGIQKKVSIQIMLCLTLIQTPIDSIK